MRSRCHVIDRVATRLIALPSQIPVQMSHLPYTDGSNGNGLTKAGDLLLYTRKYPVALVDERFMKSYIPLIKGDAKVKAEILQTASQLPICVDWVKELKRSK